MLKSSKSDSLKRVAGLPAATLVVASLGVDVVGVCHQRPPHQALLFSFPSGAAAPLIRRREAHGLLVHLSMVVLDCLVSQARCLFSCMGEVEDDEEGDQQ